MRIWSIANGGIARFTLVLTVLLALVFGSVVTVTAEPKTPGNIRPAQSLATISGNPLRIVVSGDGRIQVYYAGQTGGQFFSPNTDSANHGTFLWVNNAVYGFNGNYFTEVTQAGPTGNGSAGSPWTVTTTFAAGTTGVRVVQGVSYVNGQQYFRIDSQLVNTATVTATVTYFHAGDLYLQGSDYGYGYYNQATGGVGGYNENRDWYIVLQPITPGSKYEEDDYGTIWDHIGYSAPGQGLDNTINTSLLDNGAGLQWSNIVLGPNQSTTVSSWVSFGTAPVAVPTATSTPTGGVASPTPTQTRTVVPTATPTNAPPPPPPPPTATSIPPGVVLGQITPGQGAVIDAYKENVRITFPPGAVNAPVNLTYNVVNNLPGGTPPLGGSRLYFTLEARGLGGELVTQFNTDFEICAQNATGLSFFDGQRWVDIPVTPTADGVCGRLNHLTLFAVVVSATPTPAPGGAPGVAGPEPTTQPTEVVAPVASATPTSSTLPSRLPSTGDRAPWIGFLGLAALVLILGLAIRRASRT